MPLSADEVAELSHLLDEAMALEPPLREPWLGELAQTKPQVAQRLRAMLRQAESSDTAALPKLQSIGADDAVAGAGERVGPYQLLHEIGRGGMGSVWLAERADGTYKRRVALKLPRLAWAAGLGKRMARERDIGALLEHPNIARLYDAGVDEHGRPYIAMEYIDGQPIDVYCRERALDLRAKLKLFVEVGQAVAYAHGRLVLHRDLKPANVLVDAAGHVHLLDFGIAKLLDDTGAGADLTQEQGRVLTLNYAAPEQIAGRPLGVTADVYALGVMLYELLTGALPYSLKRNTAAAMEEAILAGDAPWANSRVADKKLARQVKGDLDAIVAKAIKRDPNERYPTADALAADIQRYLDGHAIEARPDSTWYRLRKAVMRHKVPVMAASAVLVVALIGLTTTLVQGQRAADEAERARLTTAFVSELFRLNATQQSSMTDGTARARPAVFVGGAQLIEQQFEKRPELKAEMYGVAGRTYADLGVDRPAIEYAKLQLATLRVQGADAQHIAKALMLLAEISLKAERYRDAEEHSRRAVESLPNGDALLPEALALLARAQVRIVKWAEARKSVDEARRFLGARRANGSAAAAWLLNVEAELARFEGKLDEAPLLYEKSIEEAIAAQGPLSRAAIDIRMWRAERLIFELKPQEALVHRDAAVSAMEALGGIYKLRAALAVAYLQMRLSFVGLVSYEETLSVVRGVKNRLETDASLLPPEVRAQIDFHTGWALMGSGDIAAGSALLLRSADVFEASTQNLWRHFEIFQGVGFALLYIGDHDSADKAMRRTITIREEMGRQTAAGSAFPYLLVALNLTMDGRFKEAKEFLSSAPRFVAESGATWIPPEQTIGYALARARLAAGNISGALQALPRASDTFGDQIPNEKHLHGEILCASGDPTRGLELMLSSIAITGRSVGQNHPDLAKMRADAGLCALQVGARPRAEEMADLARRAFQAQPNVSPWFKEPLKRLEKQLGAKAI